MLCKQETHGDPRACLKVGAAVSDCASEYFTAAINRCGEGIRFDPGHESGEVESQLSTEAPLCIEFGSNRKKELFSYSQCLETDSFRRPSFCRGAQAAWDHCAFAKLGIDKVNEKDHKTSLK